jgi:glucose-1-phosphate cytidylyltransferase
MSYPCKPKVGILAGGLGSRLAEETDIRPKPMVEIGGMPLLWHIMMIYHRFGCADFAIALGYKGDYIKRWFLEYCRQKGSFSLNTATNEFQALEACLDVMVDQPMPEWNVSFVETGLSTMTGGRIKRLLRWANGERLMVTWGDGVSDLDIDRLLEFHVNHGRLVTLTAVRPPARYGHIEFDGARVSKFSEKPQTGEGWINGAFFIIEPEAIEYIEGDHEMFEHAPLSRLAEDGELMAYRHDGFWQCMDTMREKQVLQELWDSGSAPWRWWN